MYLREQVLRVGLIHLVDLLMRNNPQDQPLRERSVLVSDTIFQAIRASHFNTFDPMVSFDARFFGNVNQNKIGLAAFCSISLFINDIECLLRDLYGDIDGKALHRILSAVRAIVEQFVRSWANDLWQEYEDAENFDCSCGIGLPEAYGLQASGMRSLSNLLTRASEVLANPSAFSNYTVRFAKYCSENFEIPVRAVDENLVVSELATATSNESKG